MFQIVFKKLLLCRLVRNFCTYCSNFEQIVIYNYDSMVLNFKNVENFRLLIRRPTLVKRFVRIRDFSRNTTPCEIWTYCLTALCPYGEVYIRFPHSLHGPKECVSDVFEKWNTKFVVICAGELYRARRLKLRFTA